MEKVLILTEPRSVELTKRVVVSLTNLRPLITKAVVLNPSPNAGTTTFVLQPAFGIEAGKAGRSSLSHVCSFLNLHYQANLESFLLPFIVGNDKYDAIFAIDSARAELVMLNRDPGTTYKTIVIRSVPYGQLGYNKRKVFQGAGWDFGYETNAGRYDAVIVPTESERAALLNHSLVEQPTRVEVAQFPLATATPIPKATIRSNIFLPESKEALKDTDKVVLVYLPSIEEAEVNQPDVGALLSIMYETATKFSADAAPKWMIAMGSPNYKNVFQSHLLPPALRGKIVLLGKSDSANTYFDEIAIGNFLSAADAVLDVAYDQPYYMFIETAREWQMPVISACRSNVVVETEDSELTGKRLIVKSASTQLHRALTGTVKVDPGIIRLSKRTGQLAVQINEILGE